MGEGWREEIQNASTEVVTKIGVEDTAWKKTIKPKLGLSHGPCRGQGGGTLLPSSGNSWLCLKIPARRRAQGMLTRKVGMLDGCILSESSPVYWPSGTFTYN